MLMISKDTKNRKTAENVNIFTTKPQNSRTIKERSSRRVMEDMIYDFRKSYKISEFFS